MTTDNRPHKERIYDEQISPLMEQIIAICKAHKINMAANFSLGPAPNLDDPEADYEPLWCTTCLPIDESDEAGYERTVKLGGIMKPTPTFAAFTIYTSKAKP